MTAEISRIFGDIAIQLQNDPDNDVTVSGSHLLVHGHVFATLSQADLLEVVLPAARAVDLIQRGIAADVPRESPVGGAWVGVADTADWLELATEAHDFIGEPRVGGKS